MNSPQSVDPWLGRTLGEHQRYRLDQPLGAGGMGRVYLATDTLLDQPVALKLLKEKLAVGGLRQRFEREATLYAALQSKHIIRVNDHGVTPEGYPFFVMEYLCGKTLGQMLKQARCLSVERAINIISQICAGLHLAHQGIYLQPSEAAASEYVKIIHRDLKPDNIFLVPTALGDLVKVLDFGIAKLQSDQGDYNDDNGFLGTYRYAAPEQFEAETTLDERTDIYSLGMLLHEMLTGTDPFGFGQAARQITGGAWAVAHVSKDPFPIRVYPGCEHLSPELEAIALRCLQKKTDQRFLSVNELSAALQVALTNMGDRASAPRDPAILNMPRSVDDASTEATGETTASGIQGMPFY